MDKKNTKRYDSLSLKYIIFHHLVYVARRSPTLFYFIFLKKKNSKDSGGTTLPHR
jgi:hypothetical protein